jgi:hypothetical protein
MKNSYKLYFSEEQDKFEEQALCPICGFNFVHLGAPVEIPDAFSGFRSGTTAIPASCESGHHWWYCFGSHKGEVFTYIKKG